MSTSDEELVALKEFVSDTHAHFFSVVGNYEFNTYSDESTACMA